MLNDELQSVIYKNVADALAEDIGSGDLTASLIDADAVVAIEEAPKKVGKGAQVEIVANKGTGHKVEEGTAVDFTVKVGNDVIALARAVRKFWLRSHNLKRKSFPRPRGLHCWPNAFVYREERIHCLILQV